MPLAVLVPDGTPAALLLPGRVHGDAVFQLDDLALPRVTARPVPFARTRPSAGRPALARRAERAALRTGCGDFVGILKMADGACILLVPSLPAFPQAGGLAIETSDGERYWDRTSDLPRVRRTLKRDRTLGTSPE
jgi:hypothetical protein